MKIKQILAVILTGAILFTSVNLPELKVQAADETIIYNEEENAIEYNDFLYSLDDADLVAIPNNIVYDKGTQLSKDDFTFYLKNKGEFRNNIWNSSLNKFTLIDKNVDYTDRDNFYINECIYDETTNTYFSDIYNPLYENVKHSASYVYYDASQEGVGKWRVDGSYYFSNGIDVGENITLVKYENNKFYCMEDQVWLESEVNGIFDEDPDFDDLTGEELKKELKEREYHEISSMYNEVVLIDNYKYYNNRYYWGWYTQGEDNEWYYEGFYEDMPVKEIEYCFKSIEPSPIVYSTGVNDRKEYFGDLSDYQNAVAAIEAETGKQAFDLTKTYTIVDINSTMYVGAYENTAVNYNNSGWSDILVKEIEDKTYVYNEDTLEWVISSFIPKEEDYQYGIVNITNLKYAKTKYYDMYEEDYVPIEFYYDKAIIPINGKWTYDGEEGVLIEKDVNYIPLSPNDIECTSSLLLNAGDNEITFKYKGLEATADIEGYVDPNWQYNKDTNVLTYYGTDYNISGIKAFVDNESVADGTILNKDNFQVYGIGDKTGYSYYDYETNAWKFVETDHEYTDEEIHRIFDVKPNWYDSVNYDDIENKYLYNKETNRYYLDESKFTYTYDKFIAKKSNSLYLEHPWCSNTYGNYYPGVVIGDRIYYCTDENFNWIESKYRTTESGWNHSLYYDGVFTLKYALYSGHNIYIDSIYKENGIWKQLHEVPDVYVPEWEDVILYTKECLIPLLYKKLDEKPETVTVNGNQIVNFKFDEFECSVEINPEDEITEFNPLESGTITNRPSYLEAFYLDKIPAQIPWTYNSETKTLYVNENTFIEEGEFAPWDEYKDDMETVVFGENVTDCDNLFEGYYLNKVIFKNKNMRTYKTLSNTHVGIIEFTEDVSDTFANVNNTFTNVSDTFNNKNKSTYASIGSAFYPENWHQSSTDWTYEIGSNLGTASTYNGCTDERYFTDTESYETSSIRYDETHPDYEKVNELKTYFEEYVKPTEFDKENEWWIWDDYSSLEDTVMIPNQTVKNAYILARLFTSNKETDTNGREINAVSGIEANSIGQLYTGDILSEKNTKISVLGYTGNPSYWDNETKEWKTIISAVEYPFITMSTGLSMKSVVEYITKKEAFITDECVYDEETNRYYTEEMYYDESNSGWRATSLVNQLGIGLHYLGKMIDGYIWYCPNDKDIWYKTDYTSWEEANNNYSCYDSYGNKLGSDYQFWGSVFTIQSVDYTFKYHNQYYWAYYEEVDGVWNKVFAIPEGKFPVFTEYAKKYDKYEPGIHRKEVARCTAEARLPLTFGELTNVSQYVVKEGLNTVEIEYYDLKGTLTFTGLPKQSSPTISTKPTITPTKEEPKKEVVTPVEDKKTPITTPTAENNPIILPVKESNNSYKVTFMVDDEIWAEEDVVEGESASEPTIPVVAGKTFVGWSASLENIKTPTTVHAIFALNGQSVNPEDAETLTKNPQMNSNSESSSFVTFGLIALLLALLALLLIFLLNRRFPFTYTLNDDTKEMIITGYIGNRKNIVIKDSYSIKFKKYTVTSISDMAFGNEEDNLKRIISITIPKSVNNIGENCFSSCINLEDVYINNEDCIITPTAFANIDANIIFIK